MPGIRPDERNQTFEDSMEIIWPDTGALGSYSLVITKQIAHCRITDSITNCNADRCNFGTPQVCICVGRNMTALRCQRTSSDSSICVRKQRMVPLLWKVTLATYAASQRPLARTP